MAKMDEHRWKHIPRNCTASVLDVIPCGYYYGGAGVEVHCEGCRFYVPLMHEFEEQPDGEGQ